MYEGYRLLGPYMRPDGRKHFIVVKPDGSRTTLSYPKYLMEQALGRLLKSAHSVVALVRANTAQIFNTISPGSPTAEASDLKSLQVWVRIPLGVLRKTQ